MEAYGALYYPKVSFGALFYPREASVALLYTREVFGALWCPRKNSVLPCIIGKPLHYAKRVLYFSTWIACQGKPLSEQ